MTTELQISVTVAEGASQKVNFSSQVHLQLSQTNLPKDLIAEGGLMPARP